MTHTQSVKVNKAATRVVFAKLGGKKGNRFRVSAKGYKPLVVYPTTEGRFICTWRRHWQRVLTAPTIGACHPLKFVAANDPAVAFARGVLRFWEGQDHQAVYAKIRDTGMTCKADIAHASCEGSIARW